MLIDTEPELPARTERRGCQPWAIFLALMIGAPFCLALLCLAPYLLQGSRSFFRFSGLPDARPSDFTVQYHVESAFGQSSSHSLISAQACTMDYQGSSQKSNRSNSTTVCTMTAEELDDLYAFIRDIKFDTINIYGFPDMHTCSDAGGEFFIIVTANGKTYRQNDPDCRLVFGDKELYWQTEDKIKEVLAFKSHLTPASFIVYFWPGTSPEQITNFQHTLYRSNNSIALITPGGLLQGHRSLILDVHEHITPEQHDEFRISLISSPLVYRVLENRVPPHVTSLDN
ncbi:MAG TPA: hypothetical protein VFS21_21255 [Roseiflexaceae bacterium]|nr:hypothetical protein [Roseiflexaceae bacterium]